MNEPKKVSRRTAYQEFIAVTEYHHKHGIRLLRQSGDDGEMLPAVVGQRIYGEATGVKGYVDQVVISCGTEVIARHIRSYERDDFVYHPTHYLPLLERKPGALDQAAPLHGWDLPEEFGTLRRLLEARMGRRGKREYVQVLRLLETFSLEEVSRASTKHTSGAEQKCTTREVIGQRKCPRQLFGRSVTEAGWQQAGRVSE